MKKRLRKKKNIGEFTILGCSIECKHTFSDDDLLDALSKFLEVIESNGCYFGGGINTELLTGVIELGYKDTYKKLKAVQLWVDNCPEISTSHYSAISDINKDMGKCSRMGPKAENQLLEDIGSATGKCPLKEDKDWKP